MRKRKAFNNRRYLKAQKKEILKREVENENQNKEIQNASILEQINVCLLFYFLTL